MVFKIIVMAFALAGILTGEARAQLFLENGKETLAVSGGDHLTGSLLIHNTSSEAAVIKVYWEDFQYKSPYDGTKNFLPAGTAPESASQWVTYSPQIFNLPAFGQQKIEYAVTVPATIQEGHYGVLFFERTADNMGTEGVTLVTRVGCLFFIEPKNKSKQALVKGIAAKGNGITGNFDNQGNVILIPRTTYYVMQQDGLVALRGEAKKLYVPAGVSAPFEIAFGKPLNPGQYSMVVNCDLEDGDVVVKEIALAVDAGGQITIGSS